MIVLSPRERDLIRRIAEIPEPGAKSAVIAFLLEVIAGQATAPKPPEPTDTDLLDAIESNRWDVIHVRFHGAWQVFDAATGKTIVYTKEKLSARDAVKTAIQRKESPTS